MSGVAVAVALLLAPDHAGAICIAVFIWLMAIVVWRRATGRL
jgi:hypothetical protein